MQKNLLLVDFENKQNLDPTLLDQSFKVIVFVGANQKQPKLEGHSGDTKKLNVEFLKIEGAGKNALDFHIAFELGRVFHTAPTMDCFILSADKGFDPLLKYLNKIGLKCRRVHSLTELHGADGPKHSLASDKSIVCKRCGKESTIEHNGGRWCSNCGRFASPPDPRITSKFVPHNQVTSSHRNGVFFNQRHAEHATCCLHCGIGISSGDLLCSACD